MEQLQHVTVSVLFHTLNLQLLTLSSLQLSTAITCPAVAAPSSGSIDFGGASSDGNSNYAFDVVANYNCDNGFSLVGNSSRTCTGLGSSTAGAFDGAAPSCERKCICFCYWTF